MYSSDNSQAFMILVIQLFENPTHKFNDSLDIAFINKAINKNDFEKRELTC